MTTKTTQFTPGPWDCDNDWAVGKRAINGSLDLIANLSYSCFQEAKQADAALIAAAPAMYEALQGALKNIDRLNDKRSAYRAQWIKAVQVALAQAEGRQG